METNRYRLSFTAGSLFYTEASKVADLYQLMGDWNVVRGKVLSENLLRTRTRASAERIFRELHARLQALTGTELLILSQGTAQEQKQVLWLAACKQYQFIEEFAREVIHEKLYRMERELSHADFTSFFNSKAEWHPELDQITSRTKRELRRVLFHMLREVEILSPAGQILAVLLSPGVAGAINQDDASLFVVFPISEADFRKQAIMQ